MGAGPSSNDENAGGGGGGAPFCARAQPPDPPTCSGEQTRAKRRRRVADPGAARQRLGATGPTVHSCRRWVRGSVHAIIRACFLSRTLGWARRTSVSRLLQRNALHRLLFDASPRLLPGWGRWGVAAAEGCGQGWGAVQGGRGARTFDVKLTACVVPPMAATWSALSGYAAPPPCFSFFKKRLTSCTKPCTELTHRGRAVVRKPPTNVAGTGVQANQTKRQHWGALRAVLVLSSTCAAKIRLTTRTRPSRAFSGTHKGGGSLQTKAS